MPQVSIKKEIANFGNDDDVLLKWEITGAGDLWAAILI
jgi:hypothetical protein